MNRHRPFPAIAVLLATAAIVVAACGSSNGPLGSVPPASNGPEPSVDLGSPDIHARPVGRAVRRAVGRAERLRRPGLEPGAVPVPDRHDDRPGLLLPRRPARQRRASSPSSARFPATKSVATAAITALLAGPTSGEGGRSITRPSRPARSSSA